MDLEKLENTGETLNQIGSLSLTNFVIDKSNNKLNNSKKMQSILIIAQIMYQCYTTKRLLIQSNGDMDFEIYRNMASGDFEVSHHNPKFLSSTVYRLIVKIIMTPT